MREAPPGAAAPRPEAQARRRQRRRSVSVERGAFVTRAQIPTRRRRSTDRTEIQPTPVVGDVDGNDPRVAAGGDVDDADFGLAQTTESLFRWNSMRVCDGVANDLREWIANCLDELAVDFGLPAAQREFHLFARFRGQAAHEPLQVRRTIWRSATSAPPAGPTASRP